jgi:hypothetical protein
VVRAAVAGRTTFARVLETAPCAALSLDEFPIKKVGTAKLAKKRGLSTSWWQASRHAPALNQNPIKKCRSEGGAGKSKISEPPGLFSNGARKTPIPAQIAQNAAMSVESRAGTRPHSQQLAMA